MSILHNDAICIYPNALLEEAQLPKNTFIAMLEMNFKVEPPQSKDLLVVESGTFGRGILRSGVARYYSLSFNLAEYTDEFFLECTRISCVIRHDIIEFCIKVGVCHKTFEMS